MWPGNQADSYAPTGFFGSLCNTMSSCLGLLCCSCLFRDCLGHQREPTTPLMSPSPVPVEDHRDPQSSFKPDHLARLGGPHIPFGPVHPGPMDDGLAQLGGPHSPFGVPNPPGHNPFGMSNPPGPLDDRLAHLGGPHSPFGLSDAPGPPGLHRPPIKHRRYTHEPPPIQHGYLHEPPPIQHGYLHGPPGPPEPPRVPGLQPGLL